MGIRMLYDLATSPIDVNHGPVKPNNHMWILPPRKRLANRNFCRLYMCRKKSTPGSSLKPSFALPLQPNSRRYSCKSIQPNTLYLSYLSSPSTQTNLLASGTMENRRGYYLKNSNIWSLGNWAMILRVCMSYVNQLVGIPSSQNSVGGHHKTEAPPSSHLIVLLAS